MTFTPIDDIRIDPTRAKIYEEGWQSWSPTTWYGANETSHRPDLDWQQILRFRPGTPQPLRGFQAEGLLVVDPGTGEPARVYGANDARESVPSIRAVLTGDRLAITTDGDVARELAPRGRQAGLAAFAERFAADAGVVSLRPAPTVWCSWYRYFLDVTENDIEENLAGIDRHELPVDVVQIDDGWQAGIGDWTQLSGRFSSLSRLVAKIRATGRRAGIWVAPFTVGTHSDLARTHPDWLVGDAGHNWDQDLRGLDLTHPGARDYLWSAFRGLRDAGFDYFKLDFLYSGALPGPRHRDISEVAAYQSGLRLIRDAVGPESYLLGCGAPILASVGLVDAQRVSPDTFHADSQDGARGLRGAMSLTARAWQHGRFWVNDPDCLVARPSFALREEWSTVIEQFGGLRSASDRISDLDSWGLDTTRRLLSTAPPPTPFPGLPTRSN